MDQQPPVDPAAGPPTAEAVAEALYSLLPHLMRHLVEEVRQVPACAGLTLMQFRVLARLSERDYRAGELADTVGIGRPTLTVMTDTLVRRGLVRRGQTVPGDRRAVVLGLTAAGQGAFQAVCDHAILTLARLLQGTAPAERTALLRGLTTLKAGLSGK